MFGKQEQHKQDPDFEYFAIYDNKVGTYRQPMLAINRFDLLRQIQMDMTDPKLERADVVMNAEDFSLFKIGEYSKKTGTITSTPHEHVANLHEIRTAARRSQQLPTQRDVAQLGIIPT